MVEATTNGTQHKTVLLTSPDEVKPYVHQVMPNQTPEEFGALKEDIREVGIEDPIWLDKDWAIVDGHHRIRAWIELKAEGVDISPVAANVYEYDDPEQIYERAIKRNLNRRQLNNEQKAELVRNQLKHLAEVVYRDTLHKGEPVSWTTERIARFLGLGSDLVRRVRRAMEQTGDIAAPAYVEDEAGRRYSRNDLQDAAGKSNEQQASHADPADVGTVSFTTPDGEIIEADSTEELQAKIREHLEWLEADRETREAQLREAYEAREADIRQRAADEQDNLQASFQEELTDWLETLPNPGGAERMENIPVEVWEKAIAQSKKNRTEKVEQLALRAAMNVSALKQFDAKEVVEYVMQSDMRETQIAQYEYAAEWYGSAVRELHARLKHPVRAVK